MGRYVRTRALLPVLLVGCVAADPDQGRPRSLRAGVGACSPIDSMSVPEVTRGGLDAGPHSVIWGGVRFWYCVAGTDGEDRLPVVFLHGGPGEGSQHVPVLTGPAVETELEMVYFDQRGSGRSERPWTREYGIDVLVEDVENLRLALGVEQIVVMGHSFGGLLALEYAAAYPARVSNVVTVSGLSDIPATQRSVCQRLARLDPEAYARAMRDPLPGGLCNSFAAYSGEEADRFARASMYPDPRTGELVDSVDRVDGLRNTGELSRALFAIPDIFEYRFDGHDRLTMPVLVVAGREDHQVGVAPQEALARELPNATLVILEDAGHFPHVDDASGFAEALTSFLASGGGGQ